MNTDLIVEQAISEIKELADKVPQGKHIVTADIRKLSARLYKGAVKKQPKNMNTVKDYLRANHEHMPRTAFRYALEKFDSASKKELMSL